MTLFSSHNFWEKPVRTNICVKLKLDSELGSLLLVAGIKELSCITLRQECIKGKSLHCNTSLYKLSEFAVCTVNRRRWVCWILQETCCQIGVKIFYAVVLATWEEQWWCSATRSRDCCGIYKYRHWQLNWRRQRQKIWWRRCVKKWAGSGYHVRYFNDRQRLWIDIMEQRRERQASIVTAALYLYGFCTRWLSQEKRTSLGTLQANATICLINAVNFRRNLAYF